MEENAHQIEVSDNKKHCSVTAEFKRGVVHLVLKQKYSDIEASCSFSIGE